jgi:hypothetical protein
MTGEIIWYNFEIRHTMDDSPVIRGEDFLNSFRQTDGRWTASDGKISHDTLAKVS